MNRTRTTLLLTFAAVALLALALPATAATSKGTPPAHPSHHHATHGVEVVGTITALDEKADDMTITDAANKATRVFWTQDTHVTGVLKLNEQVTARYLVRDGKNMATSIQAGAQPAAAPAR